MTLIRWCYRASTIQLRQNRIKIYRRDDELQACGGVYILYFMWNDIDILIYRILSTVTRVVTMNRRRNVGRPFMCGSIKGRRKSVDRSGPR